MTRDPDSFEIPRRGRGRPPRDPAARPGDPGVIGGRGAENLSHAILDSLPSLVVVIEPGGRIIAVNKAWERFSQDAADEIPGAPGLGGNYLDALQDKSSFEAAVADEARSGLQLVLDRQRARFEIEYPLDLHGGRRWFLLSVTPLLGAEGGAAISHVETTGRRRAEQETADQQRMLEAVLESTADGVVVADMTGEFKLFNRAARELAGVGVVRDDPAKWNENYGIFHPDRVTMMKLEELPLYKAIQGESTDKVRMFLKNPAITGRFLEISGRPWTAPGGERLGGVVVFTDITARVLDEERSRLQVQVLDAVPLAVLALDPDGRIVYWNTAAEQLFGWSAAELVGRRGRDVLLDDAQREQVDAIRAYVLSNRPYRAEFKVRKPDGTPVPVLASATARWSSDGTLEGFVMVGVDLTDVHLSDEALRLHEDE
ncbi:MAG: PAS domain-containing protein, partial [Candidatus Eisenbacteria bacterium]